jgi:hypothetical protein
MCSCAVNTRIQDVCKDTNHTSNNTDNHLNPGASHLLVCWFVVEEMCQLCGKGILTIITPSSRQCHDVVIITCYIIITCGLLTHQFMLRRKVVERFSPRLKGCRYVRQVLYAAEVGHGRMVFVIPQLSSRLAGTL